MKSARKKLIITIIIVLAVIGVLFAQGYDFMPKGGSDILLEVLDKCKNCDDIKNIVTTKRTQDEWKKYFSDKGALSGLSDKEVTTLVNYLAINMPIPQNKLPRRYNVNTLPPSGRLIAEERCTLCHPINVAMLERRTYVAWYNLLVHSGDHNIIEHTEQEWDTLAHYLTANAPIPKESLPPELRELPPSY
ncbi:MAG: hypothetical protein DRP87_01610 [Spirochaetes bacterium]|nr:MAG: hypothetical protein DRP87_01610 [Spirochaetota bacterium]